MPLVNSIIINPTMYFNLFHPKPPLPHEVLPHIPKYCPLRLQPKHYHVKAFLHSPQVLLPLPTHLTPATATILQVYTQLSTRSCSECLNHLIIHTVSLSCSKCPNHLNMSYSHTLHPKKTTNPHSAFCPSATLHTFILPSHYASTALTRLCRLAISLHCSYLSLICSFTRSGYMLGTCPLYDIQCSPNC